MQQRRIVKLDQCVIDRIAAGEVVQRPSSALKELLENSLDAGANHINVTCADGGLGVLQIRDDGCGINVGDLPLLCERFATSKLRTVDDLQSLRTFGFRGEALASVSHVARVTVVTRTAASDTAWEAHYEGGIMLRDPAPTAGLIGTTLTVADMFYNSPLRRRAFSRTTDEYVAICDVVSRFAMSRPGVGFSCQRVGAPRLDVSVPASCTDTRAVVANRFGDAVAKHLVLITGGLVDGKCSFSGWISSFSYTGKRGHFTLFVNGRLVGNAGIQRAVEHCYAPFLVAGARSFVVLLVTVDAAELDVNVHPTKHEVLLLREEQIVGAIFRAIKERLTALADTRDVVVSGGARELPTGTQQQLAPAAKVTVAAALAYAPAAATTAVVAPIRARADVDRGAMDKFLRAPPPPAAASVAARRDTEVIDVDDATEQPRRLQPSPPRAAVAPAPAALTADLAASLRTAFRALDDDDDDDEARDVAARAALVAKMSNAAGVDAPSCHGCCSAAAHAEDTAAAVVVAAPAPLVATTDGSTVFVTDEPVEELESVALILTDIDARSNNALRDVCRGMRFVGAVDSDRFLFQSRTTLYMCTTRRFAFEVALQRVFQHWCRLPRYRINAAHQDDGGGAPVAGLLRFACAHDAGIRAQCPSAQMEDALVAAVTAVLAQWQDMLAEYFGIVLRPASTDDGVSAIRLYELPAALGLHWPLRERAVPLFLIRIASCVDFSDERLAFEGIAREVALLLAASDTITDVALREATRGDAAAPVTLPASMAADDDLTAIVTVEALYKVFERC